MVIKAINFFIFPPTPPPLYKPWFHFIFTSQIIFPIKENIRSSTLASLPQVRSWQRREELTLIGRGCARALPLMSQAPILLPPAPQLPTQMSMAPPQLAPALLPSQLAPALLSLLLLPPLLEMLRVPPLWPLPRGGIIVGLGPHHQPLYSLDQPRGPHKLRGPTVRPKGVIYIQIQGTTVPTLSGYCRSPRPISRVHHPATLLPLRPHPGEC